MIDKGKGTYKEEHNKRKKGNEKVGKLKEKECEI